MRSHLAVSERRTCAVVGQPRATQRRHLKTPDDEAALTATIVRLATRYGRYGYRRIREMLVAEGWRVNVKRVYRIWRREGLKVPSNQPKRGRRRPGAHAQWTDGADALRTANAGRRMFSGFHSSTSKLR